jgi:hypothetical protein
VGNRNKVTGFIIGTCLASSLAACGGAPSASAEPTQISSASQSADPTGTPLASASASADDGAPTGWTRAHGEGFSIAVPEAWQPLSAADLADSGIFDTMREANPDAAAVLDQAQTALETGQLALFAFDPGQRTTETGFAANLNIIPVTDVGGGDLQDAADQMSQVIQLQIPVIGEIATDTTTLPAGEAAVIAYQWTVGLPSGESVDVAVTQYLVVTGDDGYILTMTGIGEDSAADAARWEQMAGTFREE